jgi:hypothetical protein
MNSTSRPNTLTLILTTLAGFAAGASLMGMVALSRQPVPMTGEPNPVATSTRSSTAGEFDVSLSAPKTEGIAPPSPWVFEAATPEPRGGPGAKRPDLLGFPEG